jgi:hypothetical protein
MTELGRYTVTNTLRPKPGGTHSDHLALKGQSPLFLSPF